MKIHNTLKALLLFSTSMVLLGCDDHTLSNQGGTAPVIVVGDGEPTVQTSSVASLVLQTSNTLLNTDGSNSATITAIARDANNNFVSGAQVVFSASSGGLSITGTGTTASNITNVQGRATAVLDIAADPQNRNISVSATANDRSDTLSVAVDGTQLQVAGPESLTRGATGDYEITLLNSAGDPIAGRSVGISSDRGNTFTFSSDVTDATGRVQMSLTAQQLGDDQITVSAFEQTGDASKLVTLFDVAISDDDFNFAGIVDNQELAVGQNHTITLTWENANGPVQNSPVNLSVSRGTISTPAGTTNANGQTTFTINSNTAGPVTLIASTDQTDGPTATVDFEFVALNPQSINVQARPATVGPNGTSTVTAIVRDGANNFVKNQKIIFNLQDVTGGQLSSTVVTTDSQGRARSIYTAGNGSSGNNEVLVSASVQNANVSGDVNLTVAEQQVFISLGTGNDVLEPNQAAYRLPYVALVTDINGNPVADVDLDISVIPVAYATGCYKDADADSTTCGTRAGTTNQVGNFTHIVTRRCLNEDVNRNAILDAGEDLNQDGQLTPGNVATVLVADGTSEGFRSDADGTVRFDIFYPQEKANWVSVRLSAQASVAGTETTTSTELVLSGVASDFAGPDQPPGNPSPFGEFDGQCVQP